MKTDATVGALPSEETPKYKQANPGYTPYLWANRQP